MSGQEGGLGGEGEELLPDASQKHFEIAAGQIGATDGAGEEGVAAEDDIAHTIREVSGRVSRSRQDLDLLAEELDPLTSVQGARRLEERSLDGARTGWSQRG